MKIFSNNRAKDSYNISLLFLGDPQPAHKDVKCCDFDNCNGASKNGQIGAIIGLSMFSIWQLLG